MLKLFERTDNMVFCEPLIDSFTVFSPIDKTQEKTYLCAMPLFSEYHCSCSCHLLTVLVTRSAFLVLHCLHSTFYPSVLLHGLNIYFFCSYCCLWVLTTAIYSLFILYKDRYISAVKHRITWFGVQTCIV